MYAMNENDVTLVHLDQIYPNPWQPRRETNADHVVELAKSIESQGLLQTPVARALSLTGEVYDPSDLPHKQPHRYELAFGHSRLAAFKLLRVKDPEKWGKIPMKIVQLTNDGMFAAAISENVKRNDLTPIEEASAMQRYRDEFGKTSVQIGELFGLSESAVRNKIRLLRLPEPVKELVQNREITEGSARELISLYDLPEETLSGLEEQEDVPKPSEIIELAASGVAPKIIRDYVERTISAVALPEDKKAEPVSGSLFAEESVSTETVDEDDEEDGDELTGELGYDQYQEPAQIGRDAKGFGESKPLDLGGKPAAVKAKSADQDGKPAEAQAAAAPTIVEPATLADSKITISLVFWPEDGHTLGRRVAITGNLNNHPPKFRMTREAELLLDEQLADLYQTLKDSF